jgi:O-antigen/teichoic acid export membrane protein
MTGVVNRQSVWRQVLVVSTGALGAQVVSFAFAPLITRLYGPEALGLQNIFLSVTGVLGAISALSYPGAIVVAGDPKEAIRLSQLSVLLGAFTAILLSVALWWSGADLLALLNASGLAPVMWLLPVAILVITCQTTLTQWLNRQQTFGELARLQFFTILLQNMAKAVGGVLHPSAIILVGIHVCSGLFSTLSAARRAQRKHPGQPDTSSISVSSLWSAAYRHRSFALFSAPQNLMSASSSALPVLMLTGFSGPASAGQFGLAMTVLGVPSALIGQSVLSVLYPKVTQAIQSRQRADAIIQRSTWAMAAMGAPVYGALAIGAPDLFAWVFGSDWRAAGVYAQLLTPWMFFQFINKPAVAAIPALKAQRGLLIFEVLNSGLKASTLWCGLSWLASDREALLMFSLGGSVAYFMLIHWVIRRSRQSVQPVP